MAVETILANELAVKVIYPFLLVFTLVFAILQKSKILGDGKKQIDAIVALVIGLIVVAFSWATDIITELMPFLAVAVVVVLVFMVLFGFVTGETPKLNNSTKVGVAVVAIIFVLIITIVVTGQWDLVWSSLFENGEPTGLFTNVLLIAIIIGAIAVVWSSGNGGNGGKGKDDDDD